MAGLQSKLAGRDLTAGEQAVLDEVLPTLAGAAAAEEVVGFSKPQPMQIASLPIILGHMPPPPGIDYVVKNGHCFTGKRNNPGRSKPPGTAL